MANQPSWLTARPVAHRGLHDQSAGLIENTLPAFEAAVARGFSIECDVQLTADESAVVFHDDTLDRLTAQSGPVINQPLAALEDIPVTGSGHPIPSLAKVLAELDGRAPLIIEMKSRFDGDTRLATAVAGCLAAYTGPAAVMSFDPALVHAYAKLGTGRPTGIVATKMDPSYWPPQITAWQRLRYGRLLHRAALRADFIAYDQGHLPSIAPLAARWLGRKKLLSWTVRDAATARRLRPYVDQIIFEGFDPLG
ncbi:MAG: glycerophosphodiester phosphodiesterase [Devosiaceae bacterium]|nr:glycerophosphodiester phosphodiesterase [Devosiaceae bacterium MH13]